MKKSVLIFGAKSFIATNFMRKFSQDYQFIPVYRENHELNLDFNDPSRIPELIAQLKKGIDAVIFCQGIPPSRGLHEIDACHFTNMLTVNLITPVMLIQQLLPLLNVGASIVLFSSNASRKGSYDPSYAASKSGILGIMYSVANACPHLRVNVISPGLIEDSPVYHNMTDDFRMKHASNMYNQSFVKAHEIADVIHMLINNQSFNKADRINQIKRKVKVGK